MDNFTLVLQKNPQKLELLQLAVFTVIFSFFTYKLDKQYGSIEKNDLEIFTHISKFFLLGKKKRSQKASHIINLRHYSATITSKTTLAVSLLVA